MAGLRGLLKKDAGAVRRLIDAERASVLCLSETKLQESHVEEVQAALDLPAGWRAQWACSTEKKGYSGVAVLSRDEPEEVLVGLTEADPAHGGAHAGEGRAITCVFPSVVVVSVYVPNSGEGLKRLGYRTKEWDAALASHIRGLEEKYGTVGKTAEGSADAERKAGKGTRNAHAGNGNDKGKRNGHTGAGSESSDLGSENPTGEKGREMALAASGPASGKAPAARPVVLMGDLNCAHREIDIHAPKTNLKSAGFSPEERASFQIHLLGWTGEDEEADEEVGKGKCEEAGEEADAGKDEGVDEGKNAGDGAEGGEGSRGGASRSLLPSLYGPSDASVTVLAREQLAAAKRPPPSAALVDLFRLRHPTAVAYSYWGYRFNLRAKNKGWRLDYALVSKRGLERVKRVFYLPQVMGSDHCPVGIDLEE